MNTNKIDEETKMEYRLLGNTGLYVSALSLGGWVTQGSQVENEVAFECMRVAYEKGCNFFDSAEVYAAGQSEIVMGQAIKKFGWERSSLIISTKLYWGGNKPNQRGLSRKHIVEGLNASLERLQLAYVDLVFAHRPDELTSMEHIVRAFNWCIDQGLCFYWGTSEWSAEQISDAHRIAEKLGLMGPSFEQPQYNMLHRERFEVEYAPLYRKWNLGTTIWSPLASGILTGKYLNGIPEDSRLKTMKNDFIRNRLVSGLLSEEGKAKQAKVAKLMEIGKELNCSVSNLALAWCLKNPNVSSVITGASKVSQVEENFKALEVVGKLNGEIMKRIEEILLNAPMIPEPRICTCVLFFHSFALLQTKSISGGKMSLNIRTSAKKLINQLQEAGLSKRILPQKNLSSLEVNGNGYFHPSICKLILYYNTPRPGAGGDSVGMIKYIKKNLPELGKSRPYVEIVLAARSGPPEISAFYNCGEITSIKTSKWTANEIHQQVEHLCDTSGPASTARHLPRNVKKGTGSLIDKVKPIWTPFHAKEIFKP